MAWVTSTTMATSGSSDAAELRAPPPVAAISSLVVATAVTEAAALPSRASCRSASSTTNAPIRLSMLRLTSRPLGNSITAGGQHPGVADP